MQYPVRKPTRLPSFDYSSTNHYFVTICTWEKKCIFGTTVQLNELGRIAYQDMLELPSHYTGVEVDCFVIMPNHIHAIIVLEHSSVSLDKIIGQYKSGVSRKAQRLLSKTALWQRSFHDHIIRNQPAYEKIWNYIEGNPSKWMVDCFYVDTSL